jgi:predicted CXXCH cytochrome family protein
MCISCHDGSIMDSRERILHGKEHEIDTRPPKEMEVPEILPLDDEGKVQCATCHTAHGVKSGPEVEETIFLRISNINSEMCKKCHDEKDGGTDKGNHRMGTVEKAIPQSLKKRGARTGAGKNRMICQTCHIAHGAEAEGYLVKGAGDSGLCLECHGDKSVFTPSGKRSANHVINVEPAETKVPESLKENGAKLGYDGIITCQTCHTVHDNPINHAALLVRSNPKSAFCLSCHTDKQPVAKTEHNLALSEKDEKNLEGETVSEAGTCSACHLPHNPARVPYDAAGGMNRSTALCLSCHAQGKFAENEKLTGYRHPSGMTLSAAPGVDAERFRVVDREGKALDLPLFDRYGLQNNERGTMTCATCHNAHGGAAVEDAPFEEGEAKPVETRFLREPSPGICRQCHAGKFSVRGSGHDMKRVFPEGNPLLAAKIDQPDLCRNCHFIHSRQPEGFVWGAHTTTEEGGRIYDRCSGCHKKDGISEKKIQMVRSHKFNIRPPAGMRGKDLPLFDESGERVDNGIMTCYTCHDPHRFSPVTSRSGEKVAKEDGRPLNYFLRVGITPESTLCAGCHETEARVRESEHNLVWSAPDAENAAGRTPFQSGACGACHLAHQNETPIKLWGRSLGEGEHIIDRMCTSCHAKGGVAGRKVPQVASHPETIVVDKWKNPEEPEEIFPIFDADSGERVKTGNMSCASCHNTHHWGKDKLLESMGERIEGDAATSFLRPRLPQRVCSDCHGIEGLYRFKYFHEADKRKAMTPSAR